MGIAALVLGIIGGHSGLLIGLFGYVLGGLAEMGGAEGAGGFLQIVSIAIPITSIVGGSIARARPMIGAGLKGASALGMVLIFDFNFFTAVPTVLSAGGSVIAAMASGRSPALTGTQ